MITRVQIKNYRSIAEVDVNMEPMTVLVGRNGSGKSSFVDAVKLVRDALRVGLENAIIERHGFGSICRHAHRRKRRIEITLTVERGSFFGVYELVLSSNRDGFKIVREKAHYRSEEFIPSRDEPKGPVQKTQVEEFFERQGDKLVIPPSGNPILPTRHLSSKSLEDTVLFLPTMAAFGGFRRLQRHLSGNFYTIFPNTLRLPQKPMAERVLNDQGENFVSVLQHITNNKDQKDEIVSVLSRVVEGVCDVRVRPAGGFLVAELQHQDLADEEGNHTAPWFDLSQESDGTLRMLGLLTALYQAPLPSERPLLALEEPEIALHPGALAILSDELRATARRRPLLVTTQSPDLIARVPAKNLRVVEKVNGVTQIGPLEESQRQVIEDQLFNAGDLLRIEGLRGAHPSKEREAANA